MMTQLLKTNKRLADFIFILWAGGAALLSYSMVYALRKPYTAAAFEEFDFFGFDYKIAVTTVQILGYLLAKFIGIKLISELKKENRFRFFITSVVLATFTLVLFGLLPAPINVVAMFFNGLSLGCMWGVVFSFLEGRRLTDLLASLLGVSIVFSSGFAKSIGLYVMNDLGVDPFWMPAVIAAFALPILIGLGFVLKALPHPTQEDIEHKSERVTLNSKERKELFKAYMPILSLLFVANLLLLVLRDIKEDFLVNIFDMSNHSSWLFAQVDSIVTLVILGIFSLMIFVRNNFKVMMFLLMLVIASTLVMTYISLNHTLIALPPVMWLFVQSLSLYIAYLTFQTIFFDRFIACFKIKGNVGFFIALIDFIGYTGTVILLILKEAMQIETDWFILYNQMAAYVGLICSALFVIATILLMKRYRAETNQDKSIKTMDKQPIEINLTTI